MKLSSISLIVLSISAIESEKGSRREIGQLEFDLQQEHRTEE